MNTLFPSWIFRIVQFQLQEESSPPGHDPYNGVMNRPGNAALLSLIIPGIGQIYNGTFLRGIFWLIITPGFWIGSGGLLGWVCHLISAYTAYRYAKAQQRTPAVQAIPGRS